MGSVHLLDAGRNRHPGPQPEPDASLQLTGSPGAAIARTAAHLVARATPGIPLVVGVTGSVAVGKTTFCSRLSARLRHTRKIETVSTDGFLMSNAELEAQGLSHRKGFPESYNYGLMSGALQRARWGAVEIPGYSHTRYDIDPELVRIINRPDILLVEGLGLFDVRRSRGAPKLFDVLIYIDAAEQDLERWFLERFMQLWKEAAYDASSFYARFRSMNETEAMAFATTVWNDINLPNLQNHIMRAREHADIVLHKDSEHGLHITQQA